MSRLNKIFSILFITISLFSLIQCASTGYPTGGPKDEDPPVMVRSVPEENSLSFLGDEIVIYFDELIKVSDIFQKLMVSPPVNDLPRVTTNGKRMHVKFQEELQANATYTLNFADAISDNNEGNVLENFTFSFSTGEYIDSLQISGTLYEADNLTPVDGALVMVHKNLEDSVFRKQVPLRVTKTDAKGQFSIQNLAEGEYKVYALEDANRNYKYDQPGERIAWYSEVVSPSIGVHHIVDSISADSVVIREIDAYLPDSLQLFMFQEDNGLQYLKEMKRDVRNKVSIYFERSLENKLNFEILDFNIQDGYVYESSVKRDTITIWLVDSAYIKSDSLFFALEYNVKDSLNNDVLKNDTINAYFFDKDGGSSTRSSRRRDKEEEEEVVVTPLSVSGLKPTLEILEMFAFEFPTPIKSYERDNFDLFLMKDTIPVLIDFEVIQDPIRERRFEVKFRREAGEKYQFTADSATFEDIYGLVTNPIKHNFQIKKEDSYGTFYIEVENPNSAWLLQVLNSKEEVVRQQKVPANGKMGFRYLRPGDYWLKIVVDENNNEKWDIGDLEKGIQPEKVIYFPESINIRANWERMIPWNPEEFNLYEFVELYRTKNSNRKR